MHRQTSFILDVFYYFLFYTYRYSGIRYCVNRIIKTITIKWKGWSEWTHPPREQWSRNRVKWEQSGH